MLSDYHRVVSKRQILCAPHPSVVVGNRAGDLARLLRQGQRDHAAAHAASGDLGSETARHERGLDQRVDPLGAEADRAKQFVVVHKSQAEFLRLSYLFRPDEDPIVRPAWKFASEASYGSIVYGKTATALEKKVRGAA